MIKLSLGYEVIRIDKHKFYKITWEDFHILYDIHAINIPVIICVSRYQDKYYVIIGDAKKLEKTPHYAIELGSYEDVSGSCITHSNENTIEMWEKLAFKKEENDERTDARGNDGNEKDSNGSAD